MLFWSLFIIALVSPPLALFFYIVMRRTGHKDLRVQLGREVKTFSDPTSNEYQKYVEKGTPYTSVVNFSATLIVPLGQTYIWSYLCTTGTMALAATCAGGTLTMVNLFIQFSYFNFSFLS